jgi:hypothetical protein
MAVRHAGRRDIKALAEDTPPIGRKGVKRGGLYSLYFLFQIAPFSPPLVNAYSATKKRTHSPAGHETKAKRRTLYENKSQYQCILSTFVEKSVEYFHKHCPLIEYWLCLP